MINFDITVSPSARFAATRDGEVIEGVMGDDWYEFCAGHAGETWEISVADDGESGRSVSYSLAAAKLDADGTFHAIAVDATHVWPT